MHGCYIILRLIPLSSTTLFTEMPNDIQQLVEMVENSFRSTALMLIGIAQNLKGATLAQARAALRQCKDVMQAAEMFFEGKFDNVKGEEDVQMNASSEVKRRTRPTVCVSSRPTINDSCTGLAIVDARR